MHEMLRPLRDAVAAHDEWPTRETARAVVDAARGLIQAQEAWDQYVAELATVTLDPDQIRRLRS